MTMAVSVTIDLRSVEGKWVFEFRDGRQKVIALGPDGFPTSANYWSQAEQEDALVRMAITSLVERTASVNTLNGDKLTMDLTRPQPRQWVR